ncbi:hypothetical protein, partial [Vibrio cortegadensis]
KRLKRVQSAKSKTWKWTVFPANQSIPFSKNHRLTRTHPYHPHSGEVSAKGNTTMLFIDSSFD